MLIRLSGGSSGIKTYLEKGHKEGREYTRDELDQRVILDGDLGLIDSVIGQMQTEGDKYLHGTISFLEDDISEEQLRAVADEIKKFTFAAYDSSEYAFYAEAHLPKIKSYTNNKSGEVVQRKPHIHFVIPTRNLATGKTLLPYGYGAQNIKFIDALQEHVNNKFGFASPKDHRRLAFNDGSELISRYKGDTFTNNMIDLRKAIFDEVLDRRIETMADFKALLSEYGTPGEGRGGAYMTVMPEGRTKNVRLKEAVFEAAFIELPTAEKLARLEAEVKTERMEASTARPTPQQITDLLKEWHDVRAHEIKLLNSGNRKLYATYQASSPEEKRGILNDLKQAYAAKHGKEIHDEPEQHRQRDTKSVGRQPAPPQRGSLHTLSELDVVRSERGNEVLLPRDVPRELVHEGPEQHHGVRRPDDRVSEEAASADNVVNQLLRDAYERKAQAGATADEWTAIKRDLDAARLLAHVSKSHGVHPEHYEVTKGKDGADRIKCGTKNYTVSDFLTKEMHLSWTEAQPILRDAYAAQLAEVAVTPRRAVKTSLWADFQAWKGSEWQAEKNEAWSAQKTAAAALRASIKGDFDKGRKAVYAAIQPHKGAERRAAVSVLRMQRVEKERAAVLQGKAERDELKGRFNQRPAALYREWLTEQAAKGSAEALRELRRQQQRTPAPTADASAGTVTSANAKTPVRAGDLLQAERITYTVSNRGDVTYKRDGKEFMRDEARMVVMLDSSKNDNIETALRLAVQKFGSSLSINGGEDFQRRAVEVAVERGLRIDFKNEALQSYKQHLEEQAKAKTKVQPPPTIAKEKPTVATTAKPLATPQPAAPQPEAPTPTTKAPADDVLSSIASKRQSWMQDRAAQLEQQRQEEERKRLEQEAQRRNNPKGPDYEPGL